ncbi:LysR substrate-binding domain-containing protein [Pantoea agglomerans]|uniref:LysR substrate-binding domain-containing protein n=1 Tax=Enterobacter agglomerans TaxID=549 RepID=UPI002A6AF017|nr:LysR substrate-binding domain-containing protein [Pantoea agglomerans]MDY0998060.1 LysR substrate-binding domain-containing protein [Pantoea agglomerans]
MPDKTLSGQFEHGKVDVALLTPETTPPTLHTQQLFNEEYVCLLSENHPLAGSATLSLDEFCAQDHALVSWPVGKFHGVTDQALAAIGRARRATLSVCSFLVLPEILRVTDLVSVVPKRLAVDTTGLVMLPAPLIIPDFSKIMAWHNRTHHHKGHEWLRERLASVAKTVVY